MCVLALALPLSDAVHAYWYGITCYIGEWFPFRFCFCLFLKNLSKSYCFSFALINFCISSADCLSLTLSTFLEIWILCCMGFQA